MGTGMGRAAATPSRRALTRSQLGRELGATGLATLVGRARERTLAKDEVLVRQGDVADRAYVVVSGRLDVIAEVGPDEHHLTSLGPGALVGEIALLVGDRRAATVRAATRSVVVPVSGPRLRATLAAHPACASRLAGEAAQQLRRTQLVRELAATFGPLPREAMASIAGLVEWVHLQAGATLFQEGDHGDSGYLVVSGRLRVVQHGAGVDEHEVAELGRGDMVGETAVLEDAPRNATVSALRDSHLVRLSREAYRVLLEGHPGAGLAIARTVVRRSQTASQQGKARPVSVAVVPCGDPAVADELVAALLDALGARGRAVSSATVDEELGAPGLAQVADDDPGALRLAYWQEELQHRDELVLLRVDDDWTGWTERALRTADVVLLVADAASDVAPSPFEARLHRLLARRRHHKVALALVHDARVDQPSGTRRWLDGRPLSSHHHVRRGDAVTIGRLARHLEGTATSLVLGGGGARGFAHLGVHAVLEELGVTVDAVAGTSIGAVMAAPVALGWSAERSLRTAVDAFTDLFDYTVPTVSLLRGERITSKLRSFLADIDIADLWVPFFCVSTNLTTAGIHVHDRGDLVQALRASIAIPGVLPPVCLDGDLLVDGGVLDNVPVTEMRRRNPTGRVLAVDVAPVEGPAAQADYGLSVAGLRAWRQRRRDGAGPPSVLTTMVRSSLIASVRDRQRVVRDGVADLYLDLAVDGGAMLDFSGSADIAEGGARAARPILSRFFQEEPGAVEAYVRADGADAARATAPTPAPGADDGSERQRSRGSVGVVLLTVRDIQHRAARFAAVIVGTAVVFTLLFLMTGLVEQFHREPRDTVAAFSADGWVVREGSSGAFTSGATMPADLASQVEGAEATPMVIARHALEDDGAPVDVVVVGLPGTGAPRPELVEGRHAAGPAELVVDDSAGLDVGDQTRLGDEAYLVTGLTDRTTMFAGMPLVFLELGVAQDLVYRGQPLATTLLLRGDGPVELPPGLTALPPEEIATDGMRPLERSISSVTLIRLLLWFVAAMIIGTMVYLSALERRRDVAVLTAIGASRRQMGASIALQAALTGLVAALAATVLQRFVVPVFPLEVTVPDAALLQVPALAVAVSLVAGAIGLRTALRTDPALAFSGPGG